MIERSAATPTGSPAGPSCSTAAATPCRNEGSGGDGVALHGGPGAFDRQEFRADPVVTEPDGARSVTLRRTSPAGENGFPGGVA
jgi:hypothetical protein